MIKPQINRWVWVGLGAFFLILAIAISFGTPSSQELRAERNARQREFLSPSGKLWCLETNYGLSCVPARSVER